MQRKLDAVRSLTEELERNHAEPSSEIRVKLKRRLDGWQALQEILVLYIVVQKRVALTLRRKGADNEFVAAERGTVVDDEIVRSLESMWAGGKYRFRPQYLPRFCPLSLPCTPRSTLSEDSAEGVRMFLFVRGWQV